MSFARTKIQPPRPRSAFVERPSVQARLAEALLDRRVVLLCAPAGYGKTALLAQGISRLPEGSAVAWVAADAGDDLQRLLECMLAALEPFDPPWRSAPEALVAKAGGGAAAARAVAAEVINTLDACDAPHGVIVFDDVHRIDDPEFFRFIDVLVERMGARWCLALTSRTEPPLSLARLRAADELAEFRQLHLQFARDDARRLALASGLDQGAADTLFERTHGWPAGMRIAIDGMRAHAWHESVEQSSSKPALEHALRVAERPMFDYLVTEVLGQLRPEVRAFLENTSILPELDAARCRAVASEPNAARMLDEIERLGLFVDVLDAPVRTLRLHDLFRDALQERLRLDDPERLASLRERAAATEADPVRRIALLLEAGRTEQAAELMFAHGPLMVPQGALSTALHLVNQFPVAFRERSPELHYVRALVGWGHWDFGTMLVGMERAEAGFAARGDRDRTLLSRAYRAGALIARGRADEARPILESLRAESMSPLTEAVTLNAESWFALETGRLYAIAPLITRMLDLLEQLNRLDLWYQFTPPTRVPGLFGMAEPLRRHADLLLRVAGDEPTPLRALAVLVQGWEALWQGRVAEARALWRRAEADAEWTGATAPVQGYMLAQKALLHAVAGDCESAVAVALSRVQTHQAGYGDWGRYVLLLFVARIAAICSDRDALRDALAQMDALKPTLGSAQRAGRMRPEMPARAQLAWLEGRAADAVREWCDALEHEEEIDVHGQAAETRVRLARAYARDGRLDDAAAALVPLFARADVEGLPGGVLLAAEALQELALVPWRELLSSAAKTQLHAWARLLARERTEVTAPRSSANAPAPTAAPPQAAEALTTREIEVLARMAAGDSNKVIARALDLSLHTVKRHVANILGKLDVATRGQAAAWYRAHLHRA